MTALRIDHPLYGGVFTTSDPAVTLPFVLPGERVDGDSSNQVVRILEPSPHRTSPACPHFGACGGCQLQMSSYAHQLDIKTLVLKRLLSESIAMDGVSLHIHASPGPLAYRNRIRLRIARIARVRSAEHPAGQLRFGYNVRHTTDFLPITTCPIAAPILVETAQALLALETTDRDAAHFLDAAHELELFTSDDLARVQLTLFCAPRTKTPQGALQRTLSALQASLPQAVGLAAEAFDPRTGPTGRTLDAVGASGLNYTVNAETYWISRGAFFQTNRFLLPTLVALATEDAGKPRTGALAWDLFAGVGLFARILARNFERITAVEANPRAAADLRNALARIAPGHTAVEATTLAFLNRAVTDRDRPTLIVLDPPRAGLGPEVCALLLRIAAPELVYVSCDPTTLARDLAALTPAYTIAALHLVDLFPQTFHQETVAILRRS